MLKLVRVPVWTIILGLVGLISSLTAYAYSRDTKVIDSNCIKISNIETTYATKKELSDVKSELNVSLSKKVSKDAFEEFKDGFDKILEAINDNRERELVYQKIIKDLSYSDTTFNESDLVMK